MQKLGKTQSRILITSFVLHNKYYDATGLPCQPRQGPNTLSPRGLYGINSGQTDRVVPSTHLRKAYLDPHNKIDLQLGPSDLVTKI